LWIVAHRFDLELRRERGVSVRNPADHAEYLQFEQIHTAGLAPCSPTVDRNRGVRRNRTIPAIRADAVTTPSMINSRGARSTRRRSSRWSGATSSDERISRAAQLTTAWPHARRRTASTASTQGHQLAATPATAATTTQACTKGVSTSVTTKRASMSRALAPTAIAGG